ncbi:hypothetical protein [Nocardia sp. NPDC057030]|uniref:hypothetical protein n=1 Tax=unclassified Nocardia TaxID=2637762 RepID=UPI0036341D8F
MAQLTQCKRCGSQQVAWYQSKSTGKRYLAKARQGRGGAGIGVVVDPRLPHRCDDINRGGHDACPHCGRHHVLNDYGRADRQHAYCDRYPDAPQS